MSFGLPIPYWGANKYVAATGGSVSYTGGRLILLPYGASTDARYSNNADVWTASTIQSGNWYGACWSPDLKIFVGVAEDDKISWSSDGIAWTASTNVGSTHHEVIWVPFASKFVSGSSVTGMVYSSDGKNWTATTASVTIGADDLAVNGSIVVAVGANGMQTSTDCITWTSRTATGSYHAADWSPQRGIFMAGAVGGQFSTSSDGINWSYNTTSPAESFRSIAWSPTLNLWCAASYGRKMCYSSGTTWTQSTSANANWWDVVWQPEYNRFVACALSNTKVYWSSDAITWTASTTTITSRSWTSLAYAPGLSTNF